MPLANIFSHLRTRIARNAHEGELLSGASAALAVRLFTIVANYSLLLLISWRLGANGIGVFNLAIIFLAISALFSSLGISTCIVRFVASLSTENDPSAVLRLYGQILKLVLPISLILSAAVFFSDEYLAKNLFNDSALIAPIRWISYALPFLTVTLVNVEFFRGLKRIFLSEFFRNASYLFITLLGVLLIGKEALTSLHPIAFYLIGVFVSFGITTTVLLHVLYREGSHEAESAGLSFRVFLKESMPMMLSAFIQATNRRVPIILIGIYCSTQDLGIFSMAFKIAIITDFTASALKSITMPKVSELYWSSRIDELRELMATTARWILSTTLPISVLLILFPELILGFFGEEFLVGAQVLQLLAIAQLVNAGAGLVGAFMNMVGAQVIFTRLIAVGTFLNILLIVLLTPNIGILGAAIAGLVSAIVWNVGGAIYILRKYRIATFCLPARLQATLK